ncbi:hypothetical protein GPECTOR_45g109 [Gonium pectorale]|uniref:Uncharacterized protein n=1 Tax=Gonium pectorale TaxID=33097 RepID=A0A150G8Q5_GONPE|nr:hypothetical protein GPECTOR_45g109 [Gonium pectorale]|eukprot:KXZ46239.1 hypothetical protein GPECTOR_45g109 [Gonium pectorale]
MLSRLDKNRFNPISHEAHAADGTWRPAAEPWQHQRVGIVAKEPRSAAAETLRMQADTTQRNVGITELRKERIAHGGLSKHPGGTMKEVLTWASN